MKQKKEVRQGAIKHVVRLFFQRMIGVSLFFIAAGTFGDGRGMAYIALYLLTSFVGIATMFLKHQETLNAREQKRESTEGWDKILLPILWLMSFFGIYLVAGFGVRFGWNTLPMQCFYAGIVVYLISGVLSTWSVMENKHFEGTSRIQGDREHRAITTGPYRIVRHPGYAGLVIWAIATFLMFGTLAVGMASFIIIVATGVRTHFEDKMLKDQLQGYLEYSIKTPYRLLPFIW